MNKTQIISSLGIQSLNATEQQKVLHTLETKIQNAIIDECVDHLDDTAAREVDMLAEHSSPANVTAFLRANVSDFDALVKKISTKIVEDFKASRVATV